MDGGQVVLIRPTGWGNLQDTDDTKDNHVAIRTSSGAEYSVTPLSVTIGQSHR